MPSPRPLSSLSCAVERELYHAIPSLSWLLGARSPSPRYNARRSDTPAYSPRTAAGRVGWRSALPGRMMMMVCDRKDDDGGVCDRKDDDDVCDRKDDDGMCDRKDDDGV